MKPIAFASLLLLGAVACGGATTDDLRRAPETTQPGGATSPGSDTSAPGQAPSKPAPSEEDGPALAPPPPDTGNPVPPSTPPPSTPGFSACAAACEKAHGTGGAELILYSCGNTCGSTCGTQNLFGKDETCTECMLASNAPACISDRQRCSSTPGCDLYMKCLGGC